MISAHSNSAIEMVNTSSIKRKIVNPNTMQFKYKAKCIKFKDLMEYCKNSNLYPFFLNMDIENNKRGIWSKLTKTEKTKKIKEFFWLPKRIP